MRTTLKAAKTVALLGLLVAGFSGQSALASPHARSGATAEPGRVAAGDTGFLTVTTDPPAKLIVDDQDTGKMTPVSRLPLPVGKHRVTLAVPGGAQRSLGVNITKGEETRLRVNL